MKQPYMLRAIYKKKLFLKSLIFVDFNSGADFYRWEWL